MNQIHKTASPEGLACLSQELECQAQFLIRFLARSPFRGVYQDGYK
tara:strand:- start:10022 stop:10159 length:138 start_codon:yes stop_codon:yes gene_type:complete